MLVIAHRGLRSIAPENTLEAFSKALEAGVDGVEFDVHVTKDAIPVVIHDSSLLRTHGNRRSIAQLTFTELAAITADKPVPSLEQVLDLLWKRTYINIELKGRGSGLAATRLLADKYVTVKDDWDYGFLSSFKVKELRAVRQYSSRANIAMLHNQNPFLFLAYHRSLDFSAVGFHRLYTNILAIEIAKRLDIFTYAYTVNRPHGATLLKRKGIDAIVTDHPSTILSGGE